LKSRPPSEGFGNSEAFESKLATLVVVVVAMPAMIVTTLDVDAAFVSVPMPVAMPVAVMITITLDDNGIFGVRRINNRHAKAEYRNRGRDNDKTTHMFAPIMFWGNCPRI
jgi:hypothetical protein